MKKLLALLVVAVALISASVATAADWSSSLNFHTAKAPPAQAVQPSDNCAVKPGIRVQRVLLGFESVLVRAKAAQQAIRAGSAKSPLARKPACGGGGAIACNQWVMFPGYGGYWYIWVPC